MPPPLSVCLSLYLSLSLVRPISVWQTPDVQLLARAKLLKDLRLTLFKSARCVCPSLYGGFRQFLRRFLRVGGVIEAGPVDVVGRPTVNLLIEPGAGGQVHVDSLVERIVDREEVCVGSLYPQTCVPSKALAQAGRAVGEALRKKNVIGYVSVDFIAFNQNFVVESTEVASEEKKEAMATTTRRRLRMWGVGISPRLTNAASQYRLVRSLCGPSDANSEGSEGPPGPPGHLMKSYAHLDYLYCPSLSRVQYSPANPPTRRQWHHTYRCTSTCARRDARRLQPPR